MVRTMFLVLAFSSGTVFAQVYKCPDAASGKLTYSDAPCASGGVQLERKRSQAEIEYDRQRAASEYQRFQTEQRRDAARAESAQRPTYQQPQQAAAPAECLSERLSPVAEANRQNKLLAAMGYEPVHPDWLAEQLQLPAVDIYKELLEHEMAGEVAAVAGGRYQRIKPPRA